MRPTCGAALRRARDDDPGKESARKDRLIAP
jgi:hypothetical protein